MSFKFPYPKGKIDRSKISELLLNLGIQDIDGYFIGITCLGVRGEVIERLLTSIAEEVLEKVKILTEGQCAKLRNTTCLGGRFNEFYDVYLQLVAGQAMKPIKRKVLKSLLDFFKLRLIIVHEKLNQNLYGGALDPQSTHMSMIIQRAEDALHCLYKGATLCMDPHMRLYPEIKRLIRSFDSEVFDLEAMKEWVQLELDPSDLVAVTKFFSINPPELTDPEKEAGKFNGTKRIKRYCSIDPVSYRPGITERGFRKLFTAIGGREFQPSMAKKDKNPIMEQILVKLEKLCHGERIYFTWDEFVYARFYSGKTMMSFIRMGVSFSMLIAVHVNPEEMFGVYRIIEGLRMHQDFLKLLPLANPEGFNALKAVVDTHLDERVQFYKGFVKFVYEDPKMKDPIIDALKKLESWRVNLEKMLAETIFEKYKDWTLKRCLNHYNPTVLPQISN